MREECIYKLNECCVVHVDVYVVLFIYRRQPSVGGMAAAAISNGSERAQEVKVSGMQCRRQCANQGDCCPDWRPK